MTELYLRLLDKVLTPVLLVLSVWLLLRGHNLPGGGFIAGLAASAAIQLQILSLGDRVVRARLGPRLQPMSAIGLLLAVIAALLGLFQGGFFKAIWVSWEIGTFKLELGTPMLFDLGVFLVVVSVVASYLLSLSRPSEEEGI
jgi:multicomponent Na+:H+ antiporter subunit B